MSNACNFGAPSKTLRIQSEQDASFSFLRLRSVSL
jgi:hypothetical protein